MHIIFLLSLLLGEGFSQNYDIDEILNSAYDVEILSDYAGIDDSVGLDYISSVNKSAYHDLILNKLPKRNDPSYEFMRNTKGQLFACKMPEVKQLSPELKTSDLSYNPKYLAELIAKDFKKVPCIEYNAGWWSYVFCHGRIISQYHGDNSEEPEVRNILGTFSGHYEMADFTESTDEVLLYIDETYDHGTSCDLPNYKENRRVIVRYECGLIYGSSAVIHNVEEISSCVYRITVKVQSLCDLPAFRPTPVKEPSKIVCQPLLAGEQINSFLENKMEKNTFKVKCSQSRESLRPVRASIRRRLRTLRRLQLKKQRNASDAKLAALEQDYTAVSELYLASLYCETNGHYPSATTLKDLRTVASYLDEAEENEDRNEDTAAAFLKNLNKVITNTKKNFYALSDLGEPGYKIEDSRNIWYYFHDKYWDKHDFPFAAEFVDASNAYLEHMDAIDIRRYSSSVQRKLLHGNPYRMDQNGLITVEKADRWWSMEDLDVIRDLELRDYKDMYLSPETKVEERVVIEILMYHYLNSNVPALRRGLRFSDMDERVKFVAQWLSTAYSYIVIHGAAYDHKYLHEHANENFNRDIIAIGSLAGNLVDRIALATLFIERSLDNKHEVYLPSVIDDFETSTLLEEVHKFYSDTVGPRSRAAEERLHKQYVNVMMKSIISKSYYLFQQAWFTQRKAMLFDKKIESEYAVVSTLSDLVLIGESPEGTLETLLSSNKGKSIAGAEMRIEVVGAEDVDPELVNALIEQKISTLRQKQKAKDDEEAYATVIDF